MSAPPVLAVCEARVLDDLVARTAEDLDALPRGSVVVDTDGRARQKTAHTSPLGPGWSLAGCYPLTAAQLADGRPMLVVHRPT